MQGFAAASIDHSRSSPLKEPPDSVPGGLPFGELRIQLTANSYLKRDILQAIRYLEDAMQISERVAQNLTATRREAASLAAKLPEQVEGEVLVKLKDGVQLADSLASDYGAEVATRSPPTATAAAGSTRPSTTA